ncbi:MAG TPA: hypothetical protein VLG50_04980 [Candidatus Saccharimonadales bacterium]|nr:hypothetical protein [Candidatus Saccharimonadales bacterium]
MLRIYKHVDKYKKKRFCYNPPFYLEYELELNKKKVIDVKSECEQIWARVIEKQNDLDYKK